MKVVDREVFIVGYRQSNNSEWLVFSKALYTNEEALLAIEENKSLSPGIEFKVFKYGRAMPVEV